MVKSAGDGHGQQTTPLHSSRWLRDLKKDFGQFDFVAGTAFYWSPARKQIFYDRQAGGIGAAYSLLHEVGHGSLGHSRYSLDFELLQLEVAAWRQAERIAGVYGLTISQNHIEDCLDSYRDWIYRRAVCPRCSTTALQDDNLPQYRCFNCNSSWQVTPSRFCRPYRRRTNTDSGLDLNALT